MSGENKGSVPGSDSKAWGSIREALESLPEAMGLDREALIRAEEEEAKIRAARDEAWNGYSLEAMENAFRAHLLHKEKCGFSVQEGTTVLLGLKRVLDFVLSCLASEVLLSEPVFTASWWSFTFSVAHARHGIRVLVYVGGGESNPADFSYEWSFSLGGRAEFIWNSGSDPFFTPKKCGPFNSWRAGVEHVVQVLAWCYRRRVTQLKLALRELEGSRSRVSRAARKSGISLRGPRTKNPMSRAKKK